MDHPLAFSVEFENTETPTDHLVSIATSLQQGDECFEGSESMETGPPVQSSVLA